MKHSFPFILLFTLLIASCRLFYGNSASASGAASSNFSPAPSSIEIDGKSFSYTDFVTVIPSCSTVTIPDGKNCTVIGDVFTEDRIITLSAFSMCKYEVTDELYQYVMGNLPFADEENCYSGETQSYRPAGGMSWYDAVYFCNALSTLCGLEEVYTITDIKRGNKGTATEYISSATVTWDFSKDGFSLPTEAEWEYASRGAGKTAGDWNYKYSGSDISKQVAWTVLNSTGNSDEDETFRSHQAGLKDANALGIYDMSGNVAEWCTDWYRSVTEIDDFSHGNHVLDSGETTDPCLLKGKYDNHVLRGGSYIEDIGYANNNQRLAAGAYQCYGFDETKKTGIRLVKRI